MLVDTAHLLILGSFFELKVRIIHEKIRYIVKVYFHIYTACVFSHIRYKRILHIHCKCILCVITCSCIIHITKTSHRDAQALLFHAVILVDRFRLISLLMQH